MENLIHNLDCGQVRKRKYKDNKDNCLDYLVTKFSDIDQKIIPFFSRYKIFGVKLKDYNYWCKAAELIKNKAHLTDTGLEEIKKLKDGINKGRSMSV